VTKSEQREVRKAVNFARTNPSYAAAVLAPLMRSCSKRSLPELVEVMNASGLRDHMEVVNGCFVARQPVEA
jgi:hypothetical protein